jgi:hypothetical protein
MLGSNDADGDKRGPFFEHRRGRVAATADRSHGEALRERVTRVRLVAATRGKARRSPTCKTA